MPNSNANLLFIHNRYFNGVPVLSSRKQLKSKEQCLIILIFITFIVVFCGTFFYLPDLSINSDTRQNVFKVYKQMQNAGPELLLPVPLYEYDVKENINKQFALHHKIDPHLLDDKYKLKVKIEKENHKVLEKPNVIQQEISKVPEIKEQIIKNSGDEGLSNDLLPNKYQKLPVISGGEDPDENIRTKRLKIVEMMRHAWMNYVKYAWGANELKPITKKAHNNSVFGYAPLGASIVDGLDTLYIMGFHAEFKRGRDWIATYLNVDNINMDLSVFEINIRFIGGLLSCYALTGDIIFREKAENIAYKLLPAFQTPTGIPYSVVNFKTGSFKNYHWASGGNSILSEFGTLHLEFSYLSDVTGNKIFKEKVQKIRKVLKEAEKPKGLYPIYLNPKTGKWGQPHMTMGGLGDSFYEYLLKSYIQSGKQDTESKEMFEDAMKAILKYMLQKSPSGLMYIADLKYDKIEHKMDALACFSGGLYSLASKSLNSEMSDKYMSVAEGITNTCHEAYNRSTAKLAPESFRFREAIEAKAYKSSDKYYILRPETVESYFIMWRLTKDPKYRAWGWEVVEALEKNCRVEAGYSGIQNVYQLKPMLDDVQQSYFLAEMLKYLYLLFSNDSLISLDEWVFNSEGHPLPIKGSNPFYREQISVT